MTTDADYTHRPNCLAEYRSRSTTCLDCGTKLVPGPSPVREDVEPGRLEVVRAAILVPVEELDRAREILGIAF